MPVEISYFPRPSMLRVTRISVSVVLRCSLACLGDDALRLDVFTPPPRGEDQVAQPLHAMPREEPEYVDSNPRSDARSLHIQGRSLGHARGFREHAEPQRSSHAPRRFE